MKGKFLPLFIISIVIISSISLQAESAKQNEWHPPHISVDFIPRITIVHVDDSDFNTQYNFLASIPMSVYHYNGTAYYSLILPDNFCMPVEYIMEDWKTYLDMVGGLQHINFVGDIPLSKKINVLNLYGIGWEDVTNITGNVFDISASIALHDWKYGERVVIAPYLPSPDNELIESISNAPVFASLYNAPLLFTDVNQLPQNISYVLQTLGVNNVTIVDISNAISTGVINQISSMGINVEILDSEASIVSRAMALTNQSMLCAIIYNWQNLPAALHGARYGGYVLFLPDTITYLTNSVWDSIENLRMPARKVLELYELPENVRYGEQQIANDFYNWLDSLGGNDPDKLEIVATFNTAPYYDPSNGFGVNFERALNGDPSNPTANGAIAYRIPLNFTGNIAIVNRGASYRATIFANPRPNHITLAMNAYEVQHQVNAGSPVVDSWGTNHIVNEIFGWPYRGWCPDNNFFPWQDIHNNTPNLSPILPPGPGDGPDCDPGTFATFLGMNYEAHFHSGAYAGTGSHPAQPDVPNIGFVADVENGSVFLYFSCHGGGTGIAVREYDNGIAQDYNGESWGSPYWPDDDGRTYDGSNGGYYSQTDLDNDLTNTHGLMIGYNACDMANGEMNEILLEHGGIMSIGSYTSVSFTGSGWWWNLFTYLITFENYSLGEAATYATARTAPLYAPNSKSRGVDTSLYYVCYGDGMVEFSKPYWSIPQPIPINTNFGGHVPDWYLTSMQFNFSLPHGWNFITLPFYSNYTASMLYLAIPNCSMILAWNASLQDFIAYAPGSPNDFPIEDGHGYFIAINNGSMFNITGMPIESVNITLLPGWNALGWFKDEATNARSILENITSCNTVLTWNASSQDFVVYINGSPYNPAIRQGDGFFVAVTQQSEWHGEG